MFQTLYLLNYNNYYNRLVKREKTLSDYLEYEVATLAATNFNPNDHIRTEHTVNIDDDISPDYAILVDQSANIVSRWFVIESTRVRGGQYKLQLYRDSIVDYLNIILNSPCFIEKATLPANNSLIFNNENMTYNQVLKSSTPLMDKSGCAWVVGYYDKNSALEGTVKLNSLTSVPYVEVDENTFLKLKEGEDNPITGYPTELYYVINTNDYNAQAIFDTSARSFWISRTGEVTSESYYSYPTPPLTYLDKTVNIEQKIKDYMTAEKLAEFNEYVPSFITFLTEQEVIDLLAFKGSLIKNQNGEFYTVDITTEAEVSENAYITSGNLYNAMKDLTDGIFSGSPNGTSYYVNIKTVKYKVALTRQQQYETSYNVPSDPAQKLITEDAPYNIFAIPYGKITVKTFVGETIVTDPNIALNTAMAISSTYSGTSTAVLYDVQLLPYCPVKDLITNEKELFVTDAKQISYITEGVGETVLKKGVIFNIPKSQFENNIPYSIPVGITAADRKVNNECDKWRLSSPNYSNYFDFSAEKNNGVQSFEIDVTLKPFTPYIHINPNFGGLYGFDDNSPRGLVLGGDFSLPQIVNAWEQYQIQNKNFQNTFDRQIQNMEINNSVQKVREIVGTVAGTFQGGVSGATAGGLAGGGWGAVAGAVVGTGASLAAGITDVTLNEQLRNEAIDFAKDQFGYQLGNIQALPATISKVSAFNANNKIFPVLEYYTAEEVEKRALRNKIKYNGMTVMAIGTIYEYLQPNESYIKGQIIRLENLDSEYHLAKVIAKEINQGIYINGGTVL